MLKLLNLVISLAAFFSPLAKATPAIRMVEFLTQITSEDELQLKAKFLVRNDQYEKQVGLKLISDEQVQYLQARYSGEFKDGLEFWELEATVKASDYQLVSSVDMGLYEERLEGEWLAQEGFWLADQAHLASWSNPVAAKIGSRVRLTAIAEQLGLGERVYVHLSLDGWQTQQVFAMEGIENSSQTPFLLWELDLSLPVYRGVLEYYFTLQYPEQSTVERNYDSVRKLIIE